MKVLEVYSKKDLNMLTVKGKTVSKIMNDFFKNYPSEYRKNYDKNLETVQILKVDEFYTGAYGGEYSDFCNVLYFKKYYSIIHELMHMASCDYVTRRSSYERCDKGTLFEGALIEGMTEHLACSAINTNCEVYHLETFAASMIEDIDGVVESFFIPSFDNLINSFPNKKDIISLMYSLEAYYRKCELFFSGDINIDQKLVDELERSIVATIDSLIDIQVSRNLSFKENRQYADKFMGLISEDSFNLRIGDIWEDYLDYANEQVKRRILRRK